MPVIDGLRPPAALLGQQDQIVFIHGDVAGSAQDAHGAADAGLGDDTLLRRCDILSLHCPATPQTRGLVNAEALAKMKPGAILLNTARGALVDEEAVAAALHSGQLGFYGADAFVTEPLPQESPLRAEPHAILTPHIAWTTREALQNLMDITTRNLRTWLEGNGEHIVNR